MFGVGLQAIIKVAKPLFLLFKELLFGKYRAADYFRTHKLVLFSIILYLILAALFFNMTENALIAVQHVRNSAKEHQTQIEELKKQLGTLQKQYDLDQKRINVICTETTSRYCPKQNHTELLDDDL